MLVDYCVFYKYSLISRFYRKNIWILNKKDGKQNWQNENDTSQCEHLSQSALVHGILASVDCIFNIFTMQSAECNLSTTYVLEIWINIWIFLNLNMSFTLRTLCFVKKTATEIIFWSKVWLETRPLTSCPTSPYMSAKKVLL